MSIINRNCQVYTPQKIVSKMLDIIGYQENLYGKKIMENSCGQGIFLVEAVRRYILDCRRNCYSDEMIISGLEEDIHGVDIDPQQIEICVDHLNQTILDYGLEKVNWNISQKDLLKESYHEEFHYIVGNPPYITYAELDLDNRQYIKEKYSVCAKGKPDYYYAFIQNSVESLAKDGIMAYLIPNNIYKNVFAEELRNFILPYLYEIHDYTTQKLFDRLISSTIIILKKASFETNIHYFDVANEQNYIIDKQALTDKWIFEKGIEKISNHDTKRKKFGDDFHAISPVATLLNAAFIHKKHIKKDEFFTIDGYDIEQAILKKAASPRSLHYGIEEYILFPYDYSEEGHLIRYDEELFKQEFPRAYEYLYGNIEKLSKRNSDSNAAWFEFGRSQSLMHLNQEKLLISTLITEEVKVYYLDKETIPYAGIVILPKDGQSLKKAKAILETPEFLYYVKKIGINASGTSVRITSKDVNNFEYHV